MAIYLEPEERTILELILSAKLQEDNLSHPYKLEKLLEKIHDDKERVDTLARCEHEFTTYIGEKHACCKCGKTTETTWQVP
jgi:hypothetical protein